jgi:Cof subfamily protein (haloacid dehalogenase superfamily)
MNRFLPYRLLALDIDGTLLSSQKTIAASTRRAIRQAMDLGVFVTLATGRAYPLARGFARSLKLRMPIITHDGAFIADPDGHQVHFVERIPCHIVEEIIRMLTDYDLDIMVLHESFAVTNRPFHWRDLVHLLNRHTWDALSQIRYPFIFVPTKQMAAYVHQRQVSPPKLFVRGEQTALSKARGALDRHLGGAIRISSSAADNIEILPIAISKASGLERLGHMLNVSAEEMIAIGDHYNDLEMIRFAGLGVAMGNAPADLREQADYVTKTNDDDGVGHVIRQFIFMQS